MKSKWGRSPSAISETNGVSTTHAAVGLSLVQSLEELIDRRVRQPDGRRRRRQRALRHTHTRKTHCRCSCSTLIVVSVSGRPGSYLDPKVLVSPPQQGVHILQHQLGGVVQKVKVQVETQQRRGVHLLARRGGGEAALVGECRRTTNTRLTHCQKRRLTGNKG